MQCGQAPVTPMHSRPPLPSHLLPTPHQVLTNHMMKDFSLGFKPLQIVRYNNKSMFEEAV